MPVRCKEEHKPAAKPTFALKHAAMQIAAGGCAGFIEVSIMHPLDLVKTRLQLQGKDEFVGRGDIMRYNGVFDCLKKMYVHEGLLSYWKGILPPILVETPKRATKFLLFEQSKRFFLFGSPTPTPITFSCAGLTAGIVEGLLVNPFEVVKVTLQSNRAHSGTAPTTLGTTKHIIATEGYRGLTKGVTATIARAAVFNTIYFGFYHSIKGKIPENKDPILEFLRKVGIGFTAGTLSSMANIPFDVAKSRIQGPQPVPGQRKYVGCLSTMATVYREEGFLALYKGLVPKVMRLGPGGAILLVSFEYVYNFLQAKFPDKP